MKRGLIHFEYFCRTQLNIKPLKKKNKRSKNIITIFRIKLMFKNYINYILYIHTLVSISNVILIH